MELLPARLSENPASQRRFRRLPILLVRSGFLPPPRPLTSGCESETCCPSQPQENSNGKLPSILIGGRFFRSPVVCQATLARFAGLGLHFGLRR